MTLDVAMQTARPILLTGWSLCRGKRVTVELNRFNRAITPILRNPLPVSNLRLFGLQSEPVKWQRAGVYDRRGRQIEVGTTGSVVQMAYNDAGRMLGETHTAGILSGLSVTNTYDSLLRRSALGALNSTTPLLQHSYGYDNASRLLTVGDGTNSATYSYLANSALVSNIVFKQSSTTRMTTTKQYDNLGRLTDITSWVGTPGSGVRASSSAYQYNLANQRTAITNADGSYWVYGYDMLGQVTSGKRYWADNTPVAGQQFEYGFDDIGNRRTAKSGGDTNGTNLHESAYSANALNQYTSRTVPPYVEVQGSAATNATVTVNNQATYRKGEYFRKELAALNVDYPVWLGITNIAVVNNGSNPDIVTTNQGHLFLGKSPEVFSHDADGNLRQNAEWKFSWDGENRLVSLETTFSAAAAGKPRQKLEFAYDHQSRRIQKKLYAWDDGIEDWVLTSTVRYLYDGWNLIAEVGTSGSLVHSYLWGSDLSGSLQGAGGVGGLLAVSNHQAPTGTHFPAYDGNGNVTALVSAANGTESARYEYGPFHELLRATGPLAFLNPFRASTKYQDDETGWLYYGYRYYDPSTGRWLSRDPIGKDGGLNVFAFVSNTPINEIDYLGLFGVMPNKKWIAVGRCEIVILYGHGNPMWTWSWKMGAGDCRAGAAIMCFPSLNSGGLSPSQNLWSGAQEINDEAVWWGANGQQPPPIYQHKTNVTTILHQVARNALKSAMNFCKPPCCCLAVTVRFVLAKKNGSVIVDPPLGGGPTDSVPHMSSFRLDCKTKVITYF